MATMLSAQNALRELAPGYKWAGMGRLWGDHGDKFYGYSESWNSTDLSFSSVNEMLEALRKSEEKLGANE